MKQSLLLILLFCSAYLFAQDSAVNSCGQKQATENLFKSQPAFRTLHAQIEAQLYQYNRARMQQGGSAQRTDAVVTLPVVVHVIHNNGPENISDAQVQTAIQHLNEAFANTGYYDPADGVNTQIQFCLARRDPNGNATNGINRVASPLTVMNGWQDYSVDLAVKNLSRWNPQCYVNIWVVGDISGGVAGYAYLPSAHGSNVDGIVLEARYFGTSYANDVVIIHEMGHYLGLYHTFDGGCSNNDCLTDGDRICDTPPDQSTGSVSCNVSVNSCTTDAQSGFSTDQNDLHKAYMDYGNWNCMKVFTQGQSDRMNWIVQNTRRSLLNCKSCQDPCPAPVVANFNSSANNVAPGTLVNFTNSSSNATSYRWYLNGVLQSTATNYSHTFNAGGTFVIKLVALPGSALCDSSAKYDTVRVTCPVTAAFSPLSTTANTNVTVNFTNSSTGATNYSWYVNGVLQGTSLNFSYAFTTAGNYVIKLRAANGACADSIGGTVVVNDTCLRQTFQKTYGGAGDDVAYDVRSTTDGGYIMAGKTSSFGSGAYDGYVVKMDNQGVVQWSRTYGGTQDDIINKMQQTPDGGYILAGQTKSYGNPAGDAWIVKTDGGGAVQWARRYSEGTVFGEQAISICLTSDGGYGIVGSHNSAPGTSNVMVMKLDINGNVVWSRIFDSGNTDGGGSIMEENGYLMTTAFTRTSHSYHDGLVMKIDMVNGNLLWMKRYEVDGRNNFAGEIFRVGNGYRFHLPSIQDFSNLNTGRNITLTLDNDGNATAVRQLVPPDFGNGPGYIMPDGSEVSVYNEQNAVSEFNIMKISSNNTVQWAKKYLRPGPQLNYIIRPSQDGGFITIGASNPAANNDIYVAKVDVQGNSPGCDTARINVTVQTPPMITDVFNWAGSRSANFTGAININVQSGLVNTAANALCTGSTCVETAPTDTCNDFTFQKILGQSGEDIAYDVIKTPDGGMMVAGKTTVAGFASDAVIVKLDAKGNILWSRKYGVSSQSVSEGFVNIIPTSDGNFIATGWGKFVGSHTSDLLIVKISPDGDVLWTKVYGAATAFGEIGNLIREIPGGGYIVGVDYNASANDVQPMYMRLDASGNVVWSRLLNITGTGHSLGAEIFGDVVIVSGLITAGGTFAEGYIAKLRMSDGVLLWTRRIESQNRSNCLDHMHRKGNELIFGMYNADSWNTGNITRMIFKTDTSGNVTYSRSYEVTGINRTTLHSYTAPTRDGGFIANLSELTPNTSPRLVRISASGAVTWVRNYTTRSRQTLYKTFEDVSGFVTAGTITKETGFQAQDIVIIKTNNEGLMGSQDGPECATTVSAATDNNIPIQSTFVPSSFWSALGPGQMQPIQATLTAQPVPLAEETSCIDTSDCNPPPADTCETVTYVKQFSGPRQTHAFDKMIATPDGQLLVAGRAVNFTAVPSGRTILAKLRKDGTVIWQRQLTDSNQNMVLKMAVASDQNYLVMGTARLASQGFFLMKITPGGTLLWTRNFRTFNPDVRPRSMMEGSDGHIYVAGEAPPSAGVRPDITVTKITAAGALVWARIYNRTIVADQMETNDMTDDGDGIILVGRYVNTTPAFFFAGFATRINKTDGSVTWSKKYNVPNGSIHFQSVDKRNGEFIITARSASAFNSYIFKLNSAGAVVRSKHLFSVAVSNPIHYVTAEGEIVGAAEYPASALRGLALYKLDTAWNTVWTKQHPQLQNRFISGIHQLNGGIFTVAGAQNMDQSSVAMLMRFTDEGKLVSCPADSFEIVGAITSSVVADIAYSNVRSAGFDMILPVGSIEQYQLNVENTSCEARLVCDTIGITGRDTVCVPGSPVTYSAMRGPACVSSVQWQIDTSYATIVRKTDSTIVLSFKRTGTVTLYGKVTTPCTVATDSMVININEPMDSLNLGPDRELCAISTITLNAGSGFATYRWQDGSSDSTYTIHQSGTYHVEAIDFCGNVFRDTVIVIVAAPIPFDLGNDLTKCDNDTVTITAPAGFFNYRWADDYNINSRYTQTVRVWPLADTTYSVMAETGLGCQVFDTIRVTVRNSLPIDIGADTSFCQNDSVTITAPAGFNSYTWSTGETTRQIIVKNRGIYHVSALNPNGCTSKDTLEVLNLYALPAVNIGKDTIICLNTTYTFDAGIYPEYLWQDGSANQTFTAAQPGKYWVTVKNANGCIGSDTAEILRIAALPANFLDTAAEFCPYEKATLTAKGLFVRYRWSTGSIASSIQTNIPGTYWLEVTNADGCTNREYINVKTKVCRIAIDFPNAFTPNNDRKNDTYKPIVRGTLLQYKLTIYNRWGQRVFETSDATRAWDGTIGGKPQDTGGFVWQCTWQFAGETVQTAKGTLLLIR